MRGSPTKLCLAFLLVALTPAASAAQVTVES